MCDFAAIPNISLLRIGRLNIRTLLSSGDEKEVSQSAKNAISFVLVSGGATRVNVIWQAKKDNICVGPLWNLLRSLLATCTEVRGKGGWFNNTRFFSNPVATLLRGEYRSRVFLQTAKKDTPA
jgi:hypothetical protein